MRAGLSAFMMTVATSLIPGLDEIVRRGDPEASRRCRAANLPSVPQGAAHFRPDHVDLFDGVLIGLVPETELPRAANSPNGCRARQCAARTGRTARARGRDRIAGPLLRRSPVIDEQALVEIARLKGQAHLLAMSERPALSADLTDVIVAAAIATWCRRGRQCGAEFSPAGYSTLIKRAGQDGVLTLAVGQRDDLSTSS